MKKLLTLSLAGLLAVGAIGCSKKEAASSQKESEETTLHISGLDGGYGTKGWEAVVKAFEEKEGVKVDLRLEKNIADTLRSEVQAGTYPDLVYLSVGSKGGLTDTMIAEKMLTDITSVLDEKVYGEDTKVKDKLIDGIYEGLATQPYADGKLFLAPINYSPC